jgi:flagellar motor switch protein FliN/FliY
MKTHPIGEIKVPLMVVLGNKDVSIGDLATITEGTIIELESVAGEPVMLYASGEPIARGEVVVIDENFGIRITNLLIGKEAPNGS